MKKAIVTGANGFVGSAVVKELASHCEQVYAVVRHGAQHTEALRRYANVTLVPCDLDEYCQLPEKIADSSFDVFYHFAWEGTAGKKREDIGLQIKNIQSACEAVQASAELNCAKFVFAASIMQYETAALQQTDKKMPLSSAYCAAKLTADSMCRAAADDLEIPYISAVISNIYGPGEVSARLINTSIRKLQTGVHTSFSPGEQLYDFIYIDDAAKMFAAVGDTRAKRKHYYIGSRSPRPLKEFLLEMRDVVMPETELGLGELPFEGVSLTYREFDMESVYRDTGFEAEVSFAEGIRRTAAWIQDSMEVG